MQVRKLKRGRILLTGALAGSMLLHLLYGMESIKQYEAFEYQIKRQAAQLKDKQEQIEVLEIIIKHTEEPKEEPAVSTTQSIGEFTVTYYCACTQCCGKTDGITASGTLAQEGITAAADWTVIEPGTKVYIDGVGYRTVEDKGGAIKGNKIDVFMSSHERALEAGVHGAQVFLIN